MSIPLILILVAVWAAFDRLQRREPHYRVYPVIGRAGALGRRLMAWLPSGLERKAPFTQTEQANIRKRAVTGTSMTAFGVGGDDATGVPSVDVALLPRPLDESFTTMIGTGPGPRIAVPLLNFGALNFGPVSENTVRAIGIAAEEVGCLQNTGEDGLTTIHREGPARLILQLGTGYWACRNPDGSFSPEAFREVAEIDRIAMIELKLSQGAKPGLGAMLPARKNTPRVARLLGVEPGKNLISPDAHTAFATPAEMLKFVASLGSMSDKPVGIKLCVGSPRAAEALVEAICATGLIPAFITVDSGQGGSGAAPQELLAFAGMPVDRGIAILHQALTDAGVRDRTRLFAAGKVANGYDVFRLLCRGADVCLFTRAPMIAIGCRQAMRCHVGNCPSGIATQNWWRHRAISPAIQGAQLASYYKTVKEGYLDLLHASGRRSATELDETALVAPEPEPTLFREAVGPVSAPTTPSIEAERVLR
jgi:glutamate synthase domain-containing protein 2